MSIEDARAKILKRSDENPVSKWVVEPVASLRVTLSSRNELTDAGKAKLEEVRRTIEGNPDMKRRELISINVENSGRAVYGSIIALNSWENCTATFYTPKDEEMVTSVIEFLIDTGDGRFLAKTINGSLYEFFVTPRSRV